MARSIRALILVALTGGLVACQIARPTLTQLPTSTPAVVGPMPVQREQTAPAAGQLVFHQAASFSLLQPATGVRRPMPQQGRSEHVGEIALSPDGQMLAFARLDARPMSRVKQPAGTGLYLMGTNGQGLRQLLGKDAPNSTLRAPAWTPDGELLYFTYETVPPQGGTYRTVDRRVERVNRDGSGRAIVIEGAAEPVVSPSGTDLAYVAQDTQGFLHALMVKSLDGGAVRTLVPAGVFDRIIGPRYSPDGRQIAFSAANGPRLSIPTGPTRTPERTLVRTPLPKVQAGDEDPFPWDVWLINADGSDLRRVTELAENYPLLTWSPDGRWIAVVGDLGLYLVDLEQRKITLLGVGRVLSGVVWLTDRRG